MDLKFYLLLFLRRLPYFLIVVAVGTAIGLTLASVLPPAYVAQARLLMESEQIPDDLASSTVRTGATEQLQIIEQRIMTRANLLELVNRLQIYAAGPGETPSTMAADDIVADMRERTKIVQLGQPAQRGSSQATIVTVSFEAKSAAQAALVANEFVTLILQENVAMRTTVSGQTLDFFNQEVARLDRELSVRSARILEFKQANQGALPDSLDFRRAQQAAGQERLVQLGREEATLKDRRARLVDLYERTGRVDSGSDALTPEQQQLQAAQDALANALTVYSPTNPRIKMLESQVASLERVVAGQTAGAVPGGEALSAYELQLADIDGQLDFMATQKAEIEAQLDQLEASIAATPGNAITLDTLERDHANVRAQYDQAVASKARAETGDLIESLSKGQRISIIEQAVAPREPSRPNRVLIAAGGVGMGLALGGGLVFLMELMNRAIRRPVELTNKLGITPFAALPYMRTKGEGRRRTTLIALALLIALGGIPAALWALHTYYLPMDMLIEQVIRKLGLTAMVDQVRQSIGP